MNTYRLLVDVWEGQLEVDESALRANDVAGMLIRLNDMNGGHHKDTNFDTQWAQASGLVRAPYFVYNPWVDGTANFNWLKANIPSAAAAVLVDVEVSRSGYSAAMYAAELEKFSHLARAYWRTIIYTAQWFLPSLSYWPADLDYWWAQYPNAFYPPTVEYWSWDKVRTTLAPMSGPGNASACPGRLRMWQFSGDRLILPGSPKPIDTNAFLGTQAELEAWLGSSSHQSDTVTTPHPGLTRTTGERFGCKFYMTVADMTKWWLEVRHANTFDLKDTAGNIAHATGAPVTFNGGEWDKYVGPPFYPRDLSVSEGKTYVARKQAVPSLIAFQDGRLQIHDQNVAGQYNVTSGLRFLVRNGVITDDILYGTGSEHTERHARAIECLDGKGRYMRLNVDGVWPDQGITLLEAARIITEPQFGAAQAFDTGGGGDVTDVLDGVLQNVPQDGAQRRIPEFVCLFPKENTMPTVNVIQGTTSEVTNVCDAPKGTIIGKLPAGTPIEGDRTSGTLYNDQWIHIYAPMTGWVNKSSVPNWRWMAIPTGGSASASVSRSASPSVSASPSPSPSQPPLESYTVLATLDDGRGFYGEATITMYPK